MRPSIKACLYSYVNRTVLDLHSEFSLFCSFCYWSRLGNWLARRVLLETPTSGGCLGLSKFWRPTYAEQPSAKGSAERVEAPHSVVKERRRWIQYEESAVLLAREPLHGSLLKMMSCKCSTWTEARMQRETVDVWEALGIWRIANAI